MADLLIARNPKPNTRLPYLLRLPVSGEEPLVLATRDVWPGPKDLFCYQLDDWPVDAEVIDRLPVHSCWRSGQAVHLVLQRRQRRRSIFVWTKSKGRTLIFWRTQRSMRRARPGLRVPRARRLEAPLEIAVDYRERYPWRFHNQRASCVRRELPVGDYGVFSGNRLVAVIERKAVEDLASAAVSGQLSFELAELSQLPYAALIVEARLSDLLKLQHVDSGWLMNVIAALQVEHPRVNWMFAEARELAEGLAFRWLAAARQAHADQPALPEPAGLAEEGTPYRPVQRGLPVYDRRGRMQSAVELAGQGHVWTTADYAAHFRVTRSTAWKDLRDLVQVGVLEAVGSRRERRYVRAAPNSHQ